MLGNQVPTYRWCGKYARSEGAFATAMAEAYGMPPLQWQSSILDDWLALDEYGGLLNIVVFGSVTSGSPSIRHTMLWPASNPLAADSQ